MKNLHFIIEGILAAAIVVLFVLQMKGNQSAPVQTENGTLSSAEHNVGALPIAYVNVDSLLINYNFAREMNEKLLRKQESSLATVNQKGKDLESDIQDFQRKLQNNAFLSAERAQQEEIRITKKQQELQQLNQKLSAELAQEQSAMNEQLRDTVFNFLKVYNADKKFQVILSNTSGDNILISEPGYDITNEVVRALNTRYTSVSK